MTTVGVWSGGVVSGQLTVVVSTRLGLQITDRETPYASTW